MSDAPTCGGFPLPEESDGYFDADSCEFNSWFNELDEESLPPNRVQMVIEENESGLPEMRLFIYTEDLGDLIAFKDAVEWQERCRKSEEKSSGDGKIGVTIYPSLHDTNLGPVILVHWGFQAVGRSLGAITPMCPFHEDNLRHIAWLAKFETLPVRMIYRKEQIELGFNSIKQVTEDETMDAYELGNDIFDADDECELEFEASVCNGSNMIQFARQARDIAQIIPMPENWYRRKFDPYTDEMIESPVFWEAAARAYIDARRPQSPYMPHTTNILR